MPIYKVAAPQQHAHGAKYRGFEVSSSVVVAAPPPPPHDQNGEGARPVQEEDNAGHNRNSTEDHHVTSLEMQREIEIVPVASRRETFIEKEVREQLRREAEMAVQHGHPPRKGFSSTSVEVTQPNVQVISTKDETDQYNNTVGSHSTGSTKGQVVVEEQTTVVMVTSTGGGVQRSTTTTTITTNTSDGVDGGKTSKEVSAGGNRFLYELKEQAGREAELRKRRKDMGWEVEGHHVEEQRHADQPEWDGKRDLKVDLDVVDGRMEERPSGLPGILVEAPNHGTIDGTSSWEDHQYTRSAATLRRSAPKVQPFEDVERMQSEAQFAYEPQNETPIDREIRIQRDREDALRLARGLKARTESSSTEFEVEVLKPRPVDETDGGPRSGGASLSTAMKKFAESRLRSELEREKRRELDLFREGKIMVLSADRIPDPVTYVEVISPEKAELQELQSKRRSTTERISVGTPWETTTTSYEVISRDASPKNVVAPREKTWPDVITRANMTAKEEETTTKKVIIVEPDPVERLHPIQVEVRNGHATDDQSAGETRDHLSASRFQAVAAPRRADRAGKGVKLNAASPNSYTEEDVQKIRLNVAERRIEDEIAEAKKRELELRELRKFVTFVASESHRKPEPEDTKINAHAQSVTTNNGTDLSSSPPIRNGHDATEVHVTVTLDTVDVGAARHQQSPPEGQGGNKSRRLALIEQWEQGNVQRGDWERGITQGGD